MSTAPICTVNVNGVDYQCSPDVILALDPDATIYVPGSVPAWAWSWAGGKAATAAILEAAATDAPESRVPLAAIAILAPRRAALRLAMEATAAAKDAAGAADKRLHAARVERQAEILRCRRSGMDGRTIADVVGD